MTLDHRDERRDRKAFSLRPCTWVNSTAYCTTSRRSLSRTSLASHDLNLVSSSPLIIRVALDPTLTLSCSAYLSLAPMQGRIMRDRTANRDATAQKPVDIELIASFATPFARISHSQLECRVASQGGGD